jgi:hypothetical protein
MRATGFNIAFCRSLEEETKDLASQVLSACLLVIHDTSGSGHDDVAELTRRKQSRAVLLEVADMNVEAGRDDAALVDTAGQVDNDLARAVVVDDLELANVA